MMLRLLRLYSLDRPSSRMCHHTQLTDEPSKDFEVNKLLDIIKTALRGICATASTPLLDRAIDALTGYLCDMQSRRQALGADHQAAYPVDMPHDEAWTEPNLPPPADSVNPMTATSGITGVAQDGDPKILICRYGGCGLMLHGAISVKTIKQHLQENHGVAPRSSQSFTCGWTELGGTPCSTSLRAGGLAKHVCDVHLRIGAKVCPHCNKELSRLDSVKRHVEMMKCRVLRENSAVGAGQGRPPVPLRRAKPLQRILDMLPPEEAEE
ncbi:uncharacterized protein C8Q71DRAFT_353218 [Rhodofomes roseus]|uniref:C2H2-type domain-containing protein n=1 Tax=Rhodofomes roseus TaxID=34475 RepID=A0ABQ8KUZ2_9APHY|nr:uncharacterized protein C8Q71DRAFT_353218 [Rhodofomes roseus]KAH9841901.1 hypothetical protein C8Q71DRAFT_353218 [Rhodofomes roseus]